MGYVTSQFQKFDGRRGNTRKYVIRFLGLMGAHANGVDLCMRELLKSLTDRTYTRYVNWKPGSMND